MVLTVKGRFDVVQRYFLACRGRTIETSKRDKGRTHPPIEKEAARVRLTSLPADLLLPEKLLPVEIMSKPLQSV